jgi:hypothetical protein
MAVDQDDHTWAWDIRFQWRQRLDAKYRDQLGEDLTWDERGTFEASDDVATSGDVLMSVPLCSWKNDPWPSWPLLLVESPVVLKRNRCISCVVRFRRFRIPYEFHEQRD